jgi:hypothetical protein
LKDVFGCHKWRKTEVDTSKDTAIHLVLPEALSKHCKKWVILAFLKSLGKGPVRRCTNLKKQLESQEKPWEPKHINPKIIILNPKNFET